MSKIDALWAYQEAEQRKVALENAIRSTPSRQQFNKLHKLLKSQQAAIQKLTEDMEGRESQLGKLLELANRLDDRLEMETGELSTMQADEETTAEEMTELRGDVEKLNREISGAVREVHNLQAELERAIEEYQQTRQTASKAKKEYDQLRAVCQRERDESADEIKRCDAEILQLKKGVDPALLARYEKVKKHQPVPVAKVISNKCSGCNMSLPMVMRKKLYSPDTVVECENCGRILYAMDQ